MKIKNKNKKEKKGKKKKEKERKKKEKKRKTKLLLKNLHHQVLLYIFCINKTSDKLFDKNVYVKMIKGYQLIPLLSPKYNISFETQTISIISYSKRLELVIVVRWDSNSNNKIIIINEFKNISFILKGFHLIDFWIKKYWFLEKNQIFILRGIIWKSFFYFYIKKFQKKIFIIRLEKYVDKRKY